nr:hypothetical protein [Sphingopyxis sp. EG6]
MAASDAINRECDMAGTTFLGGSSGDSTGAFGQGFVVKRAHRAQSRGRKIATYLVEKCRHRGARQDETRLQLLQLPSPLRRQPDDFSPCVARVVDAASDAKRDQQIHPLRRELVRFAEYLGDIGGRQILAVAQQQNRGSRSGRKDHPGPRQQVVALFDDPIDQPVEKLPDKSVAKLVRLDEIRRAHKFSRSIA